MEYVLQCYLIVQSIFKDVKDIVPGVKVAVIKTGEETSPLGKMKHPEGKQSK